MLIGLARAPGFDLARIEAFLEVAELLAIVDSFPNDKSKWKNSDILRDVKKTERSREYIELLKSSFRIFYEEVIDSCGISTNEWNEWILDDDKEWHLGYGKRERNVKNKISTLAQRISTKDSFDDLGEKIKLTAPQMGKAFAVITGAAAFANAIMETVVKIPENLEEVFSSALNENLKKLDFENFPRHVPRVMTHELIMVALCDGEISENKMLLLKQVQHHFSVDDEDFQELLEQGKNLRKQLDKSTYLILE